MSLLKVRILDDQGQSVDLLRHSDAKGDFELADVLWRFQETSRLTHEPLRWEHALWVLAFIALVLLMAFSQTFLPGGSKIIVFVFYGLGVGLLSLFMYQRSRSRHAQRLIASLLRMGACPSCGYRLGGTPGASDGFTVCPECSAAWTTSRIGNIKPVLGAWAKQAEISGDTPPVMRRMLGVWTRQPSILDDRNRALALADLSQKSLVERLGPQRIADAKRDVNRATRFRKVLLCTGVSFVGLCMLLPAISTFFTARGPGLLGFTQLFMLPVVLMYAMFGWRAITNRSGWAAPKARGALLKCNLCASCATPLDGLAPDADGCVTCPSCTAAWKPLARADQASTPKTTSV